MRLISPIRSLYVRMVILILLFLIPTYGISYYLMGKAIGNVEDQLSHSIYVQVETILNNIDEDIRRVIGQCYRLINNTELLHLANIPTSLNAYERVEHILGIREKIYTIRDTSPYIADITVLLPSIGRSISIVHGLDELDMADIRKIDSLANTWGEPSFAPNPRYWLRYPFSSSSSTWFVVCVDVSMDALRNALVPLHLYEDSRVALMGRESGFILADQVGEDTAWVGAALQNHVEKSDILEWEAEQYLSIVVESAQSIYSIAVLYPRAQAQAVIDQYRTMILLFTLLSAFLMALTVESIRRVIYRPMSRMMTTQEAMTHKAELKQLQSQINPHFLYNVFFMLGNIAQAEDSPETMAFAQQLGRYFKYITRNTSEFVSLEREIEHARLYAQIQQMRFSNRIEVTFDELPREWAEFQVPRLFVQPFLENSFEHGLKDKQKDGLVRVRYEQRLGRLILLIEDNGDITDASIEAMNRALIDKSSEVTAVINIHQRLYLIYGETAGILFERSSLGGLMAKIILVKKV